MIFVLAAIGLSIVYYAVSLLAAYFVAPERYFDIGRACRVMVEEAAACRSSALTLGLIAAVGMLLAGLVALGLRSQLPASDEDRPPHIRQFPKVLLVLGSVALAGWHIFDRFLPPIFILRIEAIGSQSTFISLENLVWPLLLQLTWSAEDRSDRMLFGALGAVIATLSPYRGVLFAMLFFAVIVPGCRMFASRQKQAIIVIVATGIAVGAAILWQSAQRLTHLQEGSRGFGLERQIDQRLAYPLFQAYLAGRLATTHEMPGFADEVLNKLRLSRRPNLGQYLYGAVYGDGEIGEMTVLYVGESLARAHAHPLVWATAAPIALVLAWLGVRRLGYEAGMLFGIALWRGAIGGLGTILLSLALQLVGFAILVHRRSAPDKIRHAGKGALL